MHRRGGTADPDWPGEAEADDTRPAGVVVLAVLAGLFGLLIASCWLFAGTQ